MSLQRFKGLTCTTAAAALALLLTACGPSQPDPGPATGSSAEGGTASSSPAAPQTSAAPSASSPAATPSPTRLATTAATTPGSAAAAAQRCKASALKASTDARGGGAAGSVYMQLILTNSGTAACHLKGFAGVSLTNGPGGQPIGAPARRDASAPVTDVLLAPGQSGTAVLRYTQARNYSDCVLAPAAGFRIYPPEDTASLFVAQPSDACSNASIELLTIGAFQAG